MDENVHFCHTAQLIQGLVMAGKPYQLSVSNFSIIFDQFFEISLFDFTNRFIHTNDIV